MSRGGGSRSRREWQRECAAVWSGRVRGATCWILARSYSIGPEAGADM